jgi:hypothetical protein
MCYGSRKCGIEVSILQLQFSSSQEGIQLGAGKGVRNFFGSTAGAMRSPQAANLTKHACPVKKKVPDTFSSRKHLPVVRLRRVA